MEHLPSVASILNFLVLAGILFYFLRKPMTEGLKSRSEEWKNDLESAESLRVKTEDMFSRYQEKIDRLDQEVSEIIKEAQEQGEKEKQRIIERAEKAAQKILKDAESQAETLSKRAGQRVQQETMAKAIEEARKVLESSVSENDHNAYIQNFVQDVEVSRG